MNEKYEMIKKEVKVIFYESNKNLFSVPELANLLKEKDIKCSANILYKSILPRLVLAGFIKPVLREKKYYCKCGGGIMSILRETLLKRFQLKRKNLEYLLIALLDKQTKKLNATQILNLCCRNNLATSQGSIKNALHSLVERGFLFTKKDLDPRNRERVYYYSKK